MYENSVVKKVLRHFTYFIRSFDILSRILMQN